MHLTFIILSFLAHNCIGSPTQSTGLPRQDWKKWKRSQLLFNVRSLAPSNLQKAQIFQPLTPSMQQMLDEGTHSWYYMIVCCKIPQPTCKENSTSMHWTQHKLSYSFWVALAFHDQNRRQACRGRIGRGGRGASCSSMSDPWHQATYKRPRSFSP